MRKVDDNKGSWPNFEIVNFITMALYTLKI